MEKEDRDLSWRGSPSQCDVKSREDKGVSGMESFVNRGADFHRAKSFPVLTRELRRRRLTAPSKVIINRSSLNGSSGRLPGRKLSCGRMTGLMGLSAQLDSDEAPRAHRFRPGVSRGLERALNSVGSVFAAIMI